MRTRGYRILAQRFKTKAGEIDLVAVRGRRLAFVEVKRRADLNDEDAHSAVSPAQRTRIRRAAELWLARHPAYRDHESGFDLVLVAPWRWPRWIENGL